MNTRDEYLRQDQLHPNGLPDKATVPPPGQVEAMLYNGPHDYEALEAWCPDTVVIDGIDASGGVVVITMTPHGPAKFSMPGDHWLVVNPDGSAVPVSIEEFDELFGPASDALEL